MKSFYLPFIFVVFTFICHGQRIVEDFDRGLVALPSGGGIFLSWRMTPGDTASVTTYELYRDGDKVITLQGKSNFTDAEGSVSSAYHLVVLQDGAVFETTPTIQPWASPYLDIPTQTPAGYHLNDASAGDLDGDGTFEIIVKMERETKDNSQSGVTDPVLLHAYTLDGHFLWEINLGINIRGGAHYTQFMVFDLDGDGRAEVACKTAPGTVDGAGNFLSMGPAASDNDAADYRNAGGYILSGPEYLTVFDGLSGKELATADYNPPRHPSTEFPTSDQLNQVWGDGYGNRVDRFLAAVAYFDDQPSLVMCRGYYTRTVLAAWDYNDGVLTERWVFDSEPSQVRYGGQGAHSMSVGDVDGDGKDEIMYGAMAVDDDGTPLYNTMFQHGDATHLGDLIPSRPGLEFFMPHESAGYAHDGVLNPGLHVRDAATGEVLWSIPANGDIGRGMTADISEEHIGNEVWAAGGLGVYNSQGKKISNNIPPINFAVWWDGDLRREMLDNITISKWGPAQSTVLLEASGCLSNNGTKATPALSGDILGDWREEVIWRTADNNALRIFTTSIPTETGMPSLLYDEVYRLALVWQNTGYNQPPHPGFYLGTNMDKVLSSESQLQKGFNLMPNPAKDRFRLYFSDPSEKLLSADLFTSDGRHLLDFRVHESGSSVLLNGIPAGTYLLLGRTNRQVIRELLLIR